MSKPPAKNSLDSLNLHNQSAVVRMFTPRERPNSHFAVGRLTMTQIDHIVAKYGGHYVRYISDAEEEHLRAMEAYDHLQLRSK